MNSKLKPIALAAILFCTGLLQAQQNENPEGSVTTNAVNYQNVNVDLFRGRHNISIPIYTFESKHLSVPISLNYSPVDIIAARKRYVASPLDDNNLYSYVEPSYTLDATSLAECHPGFTGLGWTLNAGGVITRSVNEIPDETPESTGKQAGNFRNYDPKFRPDSVFAKAHPADPDVMYSSLYESGEDEFTFNFCGYSGTFLFYRGKWKIFSDVSFKIYPTIVSGNLTEFILETPDGVTYTFGSDYATEYSAYNSQPKISTSWYLTQIESPEGDQINFSYQNGAEFNYNYYINKKSTIYSSTNGMYGIGGGYYPPFSVVSTSSTIDSYYIEPVYLSSISSTLSPVVVNFIRSASKAIRYPASNGSVDYKLDEIALNAPNNSGSDVDFKKFDLTYTENSTEALKLQSVQESAISGSTATPLPAYQFSYVANDNTLVPSVLNTITYPTGGTSSFEFENNTYFIDLATSQYNNYAPNNLMIAPPTHMVRTGLTTMSDGFRIKKQVSKGSATDRAQITNYFYTDGFPELDPTKAGSNGSTGIISRDIRTVQKDEIPRYGYIYRIKKESEYDCTTPAQLPNSTIKSQEVGYSSVWVIQSKDGDSGTTSSLGATNYKFINYITDTDMTGEDPHYVYNNINEAGKMTRCVKYDAQQHETSNTSYDYENGPETKMTRYFSYSFQYLDQTSTKRVYNLWSNYATRYSQYKLARKMTIVNGFITKTTYKYNYSTNNLTEMSVMEPTLNYSSIASDAIVDDVSDANYNSTTTSYKYTGDFYDQKELEHITGNLDYHFGHYAQNAPVEKVVKKNGKVIAAEYTKYAYQAVPSLTANRPRWILKPSEVYALEISSPIDSTTYIHPTFNWDKGDSRFKLKTTFDQYDTHGNLLQYHNEGSPYVLYMSTYYDDATWQPLMEVKNCTYDALSTQITSSNLSTPADFLKLRKLLPNTQINSYTYDPKFGVTSVTTPNGVTTTKEYDVLGRLKCIKDTNGKILQTMEYNFNVQ